MKFDAAGSAYFYNVDFYNQSLDSTVYSFMDHGNVTKDTISIGIKLIGKLSDRDRVLNVTVDSTTAKEGTDFKIVTPVILQKDSGVTKVKVVLYRTAGLKTDTKTIWIGIHNSSDINVANYPGYTSFKIKFSDKLEKPEWWDNYVGFMWPFTETRMLFYISVLGSTNNFFDENYAGTLYKLKLALAEYNASHAVPLSDEYGLITWDVSWIDQ